MSLQISDNREAVRVVIESWAAAVRARDYNGILQNHASDFVMFDVPPPFESVGLDAYRKTWDLFFGCNAGEIKFDIRDMVVEAGGDVAFAFAGMQCFTPDASGKLALLDFRLTLGLKKIHGQWTIVHEHHSVPAED
jgi:ketosteroid isomerase-like protein